MKKRIHFGRSVKPTISVGGIALITALVVSLPLPAAEPARVKMDRPMLESLRPPSSQKIEAAVPTQGAELQAQVERKLQEQFTAADGKLTGTLTREQAQAAGLGFVVNNFDQIDRRKTGVVRFDDVKHFLRERGAPLN